MCYYYCFVFIIISSILHVIGTSDLFVKYKIMEVNIIIVIHTSPSYSTFQITLVYVYWQMGALNNFIEKAPLLYNGNS